MESGLRRFDCLVRISFIEPRKNHPLTRWLASHVSLEELDSWWYSLDHDRCLELLRDYRRDNKSDSSNDIDSSARYQRLRQELGLAHQVNINWTKALEQRDLSLLATSSQLPLRELEAIRLHASMSNLGLVSSEDDVKRTARLMEDLLSLWRPRAKRA